MTAKTTFAHCIGLSLALFAGSARAQSTYDGVEPSAPPGNTTGVPTVRSASGEAVTFTLAPPPGSPSTSEIGGFASYASTYGFSFAGGGLELGSVQSIIGVNQFPDPQGGAWPGVVVPAYLRPWGGGFWGTPPGGSSPGGGFFSVLGGAGVGYTYMSIQSNIDLDYNQRGIGVMATYRLGDQNAWFFGDASTQIGGSSYPAQLQSRAMARGHLPAVCGASRALRLRVHQRRHRVCRLRRRVRGHVLRGRRRRRHLDGVRGRFRRPVASPMRVRPGCTGSASSWTSGRRAAGSAGEPPPTWDSMAAATRVIDGKPNDPPAPLS